MISRLLILQTFTREKSYSRTARKVGLTRQAVFTFIKSREHIPHIGAIVRDMKVSRSHSEELCLDCRQSFRDVPYEAKGKCRYCYRRNGWLPITACKTCKVSFKENKRAGRGLCSKCYWKLDDVKKVKKEYYLRNKEYHNEKHKQAYIIKNLPINSILP